MLAATRVIFIFGLSILCMLTAGTQYGLSAWSPQLKKDLNCTQSDIELVGQIGNLGSYMGPLAGTINYLLPEFWCGMCSIFFALIGFVAMYFAVEAAPGSAMHVFRNPTSLGVMFSFAGFGAGILYNSLLSVNLHNLPTHRRGSGVAVLATLVGLSASFFTSFYHGVFDGHVGDFLLFQGLVSIAAALLAALTVRKIDPVLAWGSGEPSVLSPGALLLDGKDATSDGYGTGGTGNGIGIGSASGSGSGSGSHSNSIRAALHDDDDEEDPLPPIVAPGSFRMQRTSLSTNSSPLGSNKGSFSQVSPHALLSAQHLPSSSSPDPDELIALHTGPPVTSSMDAHADPSHADNFSSDEEHRLYLVTQAEVQQLAVQNRTCGGGLAGRVFGAIVFLVGQKLYWLMLASFLLLAGVGLMFINNVGHIVQSLNGGEQDGSLTTLLILFLSLANGGGRLLMGLSDFTPVRKGWWLVGCGSLMTLTFFILAYGITDKANLAGAVVGVGTAYGGLWSILPILISDKWGPKNFSMNLGWVCFVSGLGGLFFNHFAGYFYDEATPEGADTCIGPSCYRSSFLMCAIASIVAILVGLVMVPYTQHGRRKPRVKATF